MKNQKQSQMEKLQTLVLFFILNTTVLAQTPQLDSLWNAWDDTLAHDTLRIDALFKFMEANRYNIDLDSALFLVEEEYDFAKARGLKLQLANAVNHKGINYKRRDETVKSLAYFQEANAMYREIKNNEGIAASLMNMGVVYGMKGDFDQEISYYLQSLLIHQKIGDQKGESIVLTNIGSVYVDTGDFDKAIEYSEKAVDRFPKNGDIFIFGNCLNNLGYAYFKIKEYDKALENYHRCLKIWKDFNNRQGEALVLDNFGLLYQELGEDAKAMDYFQQVLELYEEMEIKGGYGVSDISHSIGRLWLKQNNLKKAKIWCEKAYRLEEEIFIHLRYREQACECLYEVNKSLGNFTQALLYYEKKVAYSDSLNRDDNSKKLLQMEFKKEMLLDSMKQVEKELTMEATFQEELYQKDKTRNILIGLGLIALLLAGGFWSRNRYVRKTNQELRVAKQRAEQSEQFKQQFLANMSHEIRTPMHAISGMVKILKRNEHLPTQDTFLNAMHTSSDNLVVILNDVLDLSKIEAGKLDIENIPMSPIAVIENVTQILKYKAEEKGLHFNYQIGEDIPDLIMGDPTRLNQILINLAGNAIKFTEKGNVNILVQRVNGRLKFSVKDTGIGISQEKIKTIFGAFEQAKDSTSRNYGGTGLGLSISKQLVELQQGKIWAESEEGKGSTFFVELPLVAAASNAVSENIITEEKLKSMAASLKGIRILLAEDNPFNQMIAQDDLSFFIKNVKIDVVENGALAVEKFQRESYDLILMDVQMPEMNGFEATRKIRELENSEGRETAIPIIAMTASLLKSEVDNCYDAGMNNYIPKPYQSKELIVPIYKEVKLN